MPSASAPILVTGFEPFGEETMNASWDAVRLLPDTLDGHPVEKRLIPVMFGESGDMVANLIEELDPAAVLAVGEAGGRTSLTIERVAVNVMDATLPDNAAFEPKNLPVVEGGPDAYLTRLPLEASCECCRSAGIPVAISNTAGLYVCNQLMYRILHYLAIDGRDIPAGFVHVPYEIAQTVTKPQLASMASETSAQGLISILKASLC